MASARPIIASDLPSIREVLDDESAVLVEPDSARALREGVQRVLSNPLLAEKITAHARGRVAEYTWEKRAAHILTKTKTPPL